MCDSSDEFDAVMQLRNAMATAGTLGNYDFDIVAPVVEVLLVVLVVVVVVVVTFASVCCESGGARPMASVHAACEVAQCPTDAR